MTLPDETLIDVKIATAVAQMRAERWCDRLYILAALGAVGLIAAVLPALCP